MPYQDAAGLHEVYSDFNDYERLPDGRVRIAPGPEPCSLTFELLADLTDGEQVEIVLPGELEARGILQSEPVDAQRFWYAMLPNWDAIHNVHPDAFAPRQQSVQAS